MEPPHVEEVARARRRVRLLVLRAANARRQQALSLNAASNVKTTTKNQSSNQTQVLEEEDQANEQAHTMELFAPFSPSPVSLIAAVWRRLNDEHELANHDGKLLNATDLLVDLGCGDGRWLLAAAHEFGCCALGIELDAKVVHLAREQVRQAMHSAVSASDFKKLARIEIVQQDILQVDISRARFVIVYAFAKALDGIRDFLQRQLLPNAYVLSIGFRIRGWKPRICERSDGMRWYFYDMNDL